MLVNVSFFKENFLQLCYCIVLSNKKICIEKLEFRFVKVLHDLRHTSRKVLPKQNRLAPERRIGLFFVSLGVESRLRWRKGFAKVRLRCSRLDIEQHSISEHTLKNKTITMCFVIQVLFFFVVYVTETIIAIFDYIFHSTLHNSTILRIPLTALCTAPTALTTNLLNGFV